MRYTYIHAIAHFHPDASIEMKNPNDFASISFQSTFLNLDKNQLDNWISEKNEHEAFFLLRKERNKRLLETDWMILRATSTDSQLPTEWRDYMQALRDLPSYSNPNLNASNGQLDMSSVNWPIPPMTRNP
jgi:hypothetical protein